VGRDIVPHIQLDRHYTGQMEDAMEFATGQINDVSSIYLAQRFTGQYAREAFCCNACATMTPTHNSADVGSRLYTCIPLEPLPVCSRDTDSIQAAIDRLAEPEQMDKNFTEHQCSGCTSRAPPKKYRGIESSPAVLMLTLSRILNARSGRVTLQEVTPMVDATIVVCGQLYSLKAILYHSGSTPNSGHYIAVVKHGSAPDDFWYYDDLRVRQRATEAERCGQAEGYKVYAVMYEF
jgi:ubiquitin C-terminal hydrolase